jgi:hypothetical protein
MAQSVQRRATVWIAEIRFPAGEKRFVATPRVQAGYGATQPPIQWVLGRLSPAAKRPGREADH